MTVALHCRLARPGRVAGIAEFMDFAKGYGRDVWICTREEIADHWIEYHSPKGAGVPVRELESMELNSPKSTGSEPYEAEFEGGKDGTADETAEDVI